MLNWMKRHGPTTRDDRPVYADPPKRQGCERSGKYVLLCDYLENRYANTVVLTFRQIEDLLGFALPDRARTEQEWWTMRDLGASGGRYSDAWVLAGRTARPNLPAGNVVFERVS
jgi:hypothetical protein